MTPTMRCIIWQGPGRVTLDPRVVPTPAPGQVLIEVRYNGLCSTDYPIVEGQVAVAWPGMALGHEPVGPIVALGAGVAGWTLGQRVVLDTMLACGRCRFCQQGHTELCAHSDEIGFSVDGNWSDYATLPAANLRAVPDAIGNLEATMLEALTCQMGAIEALDIRFGETVAIIGSGLAALTFIQLLHLKGAGHIAIAMRSYPERVALAQSFGVDQVVCDGDLRALRSQAQVQADEGYDVTIDAVGTQETAQSALSLVRRGGRVLLYGLRSAVMRDFPLGETIFRNLTLYGRTSAPWMWQPAIDLVARGVLRLRPLIGEVLDLEQVPALLTQPRAPGGPLKRVIRIQGEK
jgi:threonine dehydrogenase-like Zn-dependent dehydrogenase